MILLTRLVPHVNTMHTTIETGDTMPSDESASDSSISHRLVHFPFSDFAPFEFDLMTMFAGNFARTFPILLLFRVADETIDRSTWIVDVVAWMMIAVIVVESRCRDPVTR